MYMMCAIESSMQAQVVSAQEEMARMEIAELSKKCQCFSFVYSMQLHFHTNLMCIVIINGIIIQHQLS